MRVQLIEDRDDEGAVAILVAFLTVVVVVLAAFTADVGMAYSQRQALATGADSAALAIVRHEYAVLGGAPTQTCAQLVAADSALAAGASGKASTIAVAQINANAPFGSVVPAAGVTTTLSCVGTGGGTLQATVSVSKSVPTVFAGIVGISSLSVNRTAAAALGAANEVTGLRPIGVCTNQANAIIADAIADVPTRSSTYRHELVTVNKVWGTTTECGSGSNAGSGNWGWLNIPPAVSPGGNKLADVITYGSGMTITVDNSTSPPSVLLDSETGNKGNGSGVDAAMASIMDKVVTLPVYSMVSGNGTNTKYTVVGFLSVRMCGYSTQNLNKAVTGSCYVTTEPLNAPASPNVALVDQSMQVQYVNYTPVGQLSTLCGINVSGQTCDFHSYVTKLIR